jgi:hypothetical protein
MEEITRKLCGFPETNRQKTAGDGIKTSGMTCLLGVKKSFDLLKGGVRRITTGFIQQENSMDGAAL